MTRQQLYISNSSALPSPLTILYSFCRMFNRIASYFCYHYFFQKPSSHRFIFQWKKQRHRFIWRLALDLRAVVLFLRRSKSYKASRLKAAKPPFHFFLLLWGFLRSDSFIMRCSEIFCWGEKSFFEEALLPENFPLPFARFGFAFAQPSPRFFLCPSALSAPSPFGFAFTDGADF